MLLGPAALTRLLRACLLALACLATPPVARADAEAWHWLEYRMPVAAPWGTRSATPRIAWRINSDVRTNVRSRGLHMAFLRAGPLMELSDNFMLAAHGTVIGERLPSGVFAMETRAELEPWVQGRLGPVTWQDRNRLEVRFRPDRVRLRYRNLLRINWAPAGSRAQPYAWNEVLFDLGGEGNHQNRLTVGVAAMVGNGVRLDGGFMLRTRRVPTGWTHDQVALLSVVILWPSG